MRVTLSLALVAVLASSVWAGVTAKVYLADEETPLEPNDPNVPDIYRDIMVGTHLTIFIESDTPEPGMGALLIPWEDTTQGLLGGRSPEQHIYWGSCLEAAGDDPVVVRMSSMRGDGFTFGAHLMAEAGRWFVFDYYATEAGICEIERSDYLAALEDPDFDGGIPDPVQVLSFSHVPSRDFDNNTIVDFTDFASLAAMWDQPAITDPNVVHPEDINADGLVDTLDMLLFADYWLEKTDFNEPANEPNEPPTDPNLPLGTT